VEKRSEKYTARVRKRESEMAPERKEIGYALHESNSQTTVICLLLDILETLEEIRDKEA
jgi:hypothetical protein